jgi:hypothetical protein
MTTQDIYSWVQMGLQIVIGGGIVVGISRYFGILRKTIDAQAEQMKAQSTVLQDFEPLNQIMKQVIDTVSDPAALQREQAYRERVDRDAHAQVDETTRGFTALIGNILPYIPPNEWMRLINAADLPSASKEILRGLAEAAPSAGRLISSIAASSVSMADIVEHIVLTEPILLSKESQDGT